eukprot:TRINITY_DN5473_c1_g1_i6.p1 TRINITY_DN5473_c1_g1~~TRINITY_DN5473_c1_g1_i6.p1  ORF type:complete len:435 (-),score=62.29 TRINITY_DN5473_c1_g1_i6:153-1457(-)
MGKDLASVVVVTTKGCPYCKKAKALLKEEGVEYSELELSTDKGLLQRVKDFTGQRTVPQIFIGNEFIGGASELQKVKDDGQLGSKVESAIKSELKSEVKSLLNAIQASREQSESKSYPGSLPKDEYLELQSIVKTLGDQPFTLAEVSGKLSPRSVQSDIDDLIQKLQQANLLTSLSPSAKTPEWKQYQTTTSVPGPTKITTPLNTHFEFYGEARPAIVVAGELREMILGLYDKHLSSNGKAVDYVGISKDPLYREFYAATAELQKVSLEQLTQSRDETMAFFINIYNALIVHGTVVFGVPPNTIARVKFFGQVSYQIGGYRFTADDIEHGILRDNAVSPASIGSLLGIPFFKYNQFPNEVVLKDDKTTLEMSKIFDWYGGDFGTKLDLLKFIKQRASEPLKSQLSEQVKLAEKESGKVGLKFKFRTYDWGANEK